MKEHQIKIKENERKQEGGRRIRIQSGQSDHIVSKQMLAKVRTENPCPLLPFDHYFSISIFPLLQFESNTLETASPTAHPYAGKQIKS